MKIGDVESGVPVPVSPKSKYHLVSINADRLKVDQSFLVQPEDGEDISLRGLACVMGRLGKKRGRKFLCADVGEGCIRVWRTE